MAYATVADMQSRFQEQLLAQLSDPNGYEIKEGPIRAALDDASAEVDACLSRFLPLKTVPAVLRLHVCNMACYHLMNLRPMGDIEDARRRYEDALAFMGSVSKGLIDLGLDTAGQPVPSSCGPISHSADRIFSMDTLARWP